VVLTDTQNRTLTTTSSAGASKSDWSFNYIPIAVSVSQVTVEIYIVDTTSPVLVSTSIPIQVAMGSPTIITLPYATLPINSTANLATLTGGNASVEGSFAITDTSVPLITSSYETEVQFTPKDETNYKTVYANITVYVLSVTSANSVYTGYAGNAIIIDGAINGTSQPYKVVLTDTQNRTLTTTSSAGASKSDWSFNYIPTAVSVSQVTVEIYIVDTTSPVLVSTSIPIQVAMGSPTIITVPYATLPINSTANLATLTGGNASVEGSFAITDTAVYSKPGSYTTTVYFTPKDETSYNTVSADIVVWVLSLTFNQSTYQGYVGYSMRISGTNKSTNNYTLNLTDKQTTYATTTNNYFDFSFTPANTTPVTLYVDAFDSDSNLVIYSSDPISFTPAILTFPTAPDAIMSGSSGSSLSISDLVGGNIADLTGNASIYFENIGNTSTTIANLTPESTFLTLVFTDDFNNTIYSNIAINVVEPGIIYNYNGCVIQYSTRSSMTYDHARISWAKRLVATAIDPTHTVAFGYHPTEPRIYVTELDQRGISLTPAEINVCVSIGGIVHTPNVVIRGNNTIMRLENRKQECPIVFQLQDRLDNAYSIGDG
jgi:hypothetical protein